jgi:hypothetical protein
MTAAAGDLVYSKGEDAPLGAAGDHTASEPTSDELLVLGKFGSTVRVEADRLIDHLVRVARRVDPGGRGYVTWRLEQTTNDICYAASTAGRLQRQRLDDLARARTALAHLDGWTEFSRYLKEELRV